MAANLFNQADLKVGVFNSDGSYNQWKPNSRCIEIAVQPLTTYWLKYGTRSCHFAKVQCDDASGVSTIYGTYGIIKTFTDTVKLKITFQDDGIADIGSVDWSSFTLSTDPFIDTLPLPTGVLNTGFYALADNKIVAKNASYRCFGINVTPEHTYKLQNNGADVTVYGFNLYRNDGTYISRVTSATSVTTTSDTAIVGIVIETSQFPDTSGLRIIDTSGSVTPPEFRYSTPSYSGPALMVGTAATGTVQLPYFNATPSGCVHNLTLSGSAAAGLTSPVVVEGAFDTDGTISFPISGTPTTAGNITASISGPLITTPITLTLTVAESGTVDPPDPSGSWHYAKVPCKEKTTYFFRYNGLYSYGAVLSYFNGDTLIGRVSGISVFTTPHNCTMLGINLPDSQYSDYAKVTVTEGKAGDYKSLVELTGDVKLLQESGGGSGGGTTPEVPSFDLNFYLFGDSITASNITRWVPTFMSLITFKHIENFAVGGANYTCSASVVEDLSGLQQGSSNKIWNQFNRLKAKVAAGNSPVPDVIVILAGINDRYSQLGDPESAFDYTVDYSAIQVTDPLTHNLAGAFRFTLEAILNEWPDVRVIIATPLPVGGSTREKIQSDNIVVENITRTLTACAKKMALPVINQAYECGISPYRELGGAYLNYNDGLHPNAHGGEKIGKYLAKRIAGLL